MAINAIVILVIMEKIVSLIQMTVIHHLVYMDLAKIKSMATNVIVMLDIMEKIVTKILMNVVVSHVKIKVHVRI